MIFLHEICINHSPIIMMPMMQRMVLLYYDDAASYIPNYSNFVILHLCLAQIMRDPPSVFSLVFQEMHDDV